MLRLKPNLTMRANTKMKPRCDLRANVKLKSFIALRYPQGEVFASPYNIAVAEKWKSADNKANMKGRYMGKEIFVLLADGDGTTRSIPEPFGVAVETKEEAERFVAESYCGYSRSFAKVRLFDNWEAALKWKYPEFYNDATKVVVKGKIK
jgi:hypothetical protein